MSIKEQVIARVNELPETATIPDIQEELQILTAIEDGQKAARLGKSKSQVEVEKQFASWITK